MSRKTETLTIADDGGDGREDSGMITTVVYSDALTAPASTDSGHYANIEEIRFCIGLTPGSWNELKEYARRSGCSIRETAINLVESGLATRRRGMN